MAVEFSEWMSEQALETFEFWTIPLVFRNHFQYYRDFQTIAEENNAKVLRGNSFRSRLVNGPALDVIQPMSLVNIAMKSIVIREYIGLNIKYMNKSPTFHCLQMDVHIEKQSILEKYRGCQKFYETELLRLNTYKRPICYDCFDNHLEIDNKARYVKNLHEMMDWAVRQDRRAREALAPAVVLVDADDLFYTPVYKIH
jgi:hypothetical protein